MPKQGELKHSFVCKWGLEASPESLVNEISFPDGVQMGLGGLSVNEISFPDGVRKPI